MVGGEDTGGRVLQILEGWRGKMELTEQSFLEEGAAGLQFGMEVEGLRRCGCESPPRGPCTLGADSAWDLGRAPHPAVHASNSEAQVSSCWVYFCGEFSACA